MKPNFLYSIPATFLGIWLVVTGCSLFSSKKAQYDTLYGVGSAVDTAVSEYDLRVATHEISTNSLPVVSRYYNDFQAAFKLAVNAAEYGTNSVAPPNIITKEQALLNAIKASK